MKYTKAFYLIDTPEGWRYGFPKVIAGSVLNGDIDGIKQWLIKNDYPAAEIASYGKSFYWRVIDLPDEKIQARNLIQGLCNAISKMSMSRIPARNILKITTLKLLSIHQLVLGNDVPKEIADLYASDKDDDILELIKFLLKS